jgi:hypothetical protein
MSVWIPSQAPGNVVKLLECREKHTHGTGTFDRKQDQLIGVFGLSLAMQVLNEIVTNRLAYGFGRTFPAVLPT